MKYLLAVLLTCIAIGGCAPIKPYRTEVRGAEDPCVVSVPPWPSETPENSVPSNCLDDNESSGSDAFFFVRYPEPPQQADNIPIGIIEFDDLGVLQKRDDKDKIMDRIRQLTDTDGTLTVVFAHGWKNNASPGNKNLANFQRLLTEIAKTDAKTCPAGSRCAGRQVVGVYLAWRGLSAKVEPFESMSFWNRKRRAERIGQDGATEVLADLAKIRSASKGKDKSRLILIGHSFGGALIFSATQQLLMQDAAAQHLPKWEKDTAKMQRQGDTQSCTKKKLEKAQEVSGKPDCSVDTVDGPPLTNDSGCIWTCKHQSVDRTIANLVILVNPAFEAARFTPLHDKAEKMHFPQTQSAILAIFTSETDLATKTAFKLGRYTSTLFTKYNSEFPKESELDRTAVGHYDDYLTHKLAPGNGKDFATAEDSVCAWQSFRLPVKNEKNEIKWDLGAMVLERTPSAENQPMNPYYNVKVDKAIIPDHSDIWKAGFFQEFIPRFIAAQDRQWTTVKGKPKPVIPCPTD